MSDPSGVEVSHQNPELDLYFAPTPNGWKTTIMLEECNLPYRLFMVNLAAGEQFSEEFLAISPNSRIPALVDNGAAEGPLSLFESGAILLYLAEKTGLFMPRDAGKRHVVMQWLFWQVGNLGPMAGQLSHFLNYAPQASDGENYALNRYRCEYDRLLGVLNYRLQEHEYLAGEYSIADMCSWPWLLPYKHYGQDLRSFPAVRRWFDAIKMRPAVRTAVDIGKKDYLKSREMVLNEKTRKILFNRTSASLTPDAVKS